MLTSLSEWSACTEIRAIAVFLQKLGLTISFSSFCSHSLVHLLCMSCFPVAHAVHFPGLLTGVLQASNPSNQQRGVWLCLWLFLWLRAPVNNPQSSGSVPPMAGLRGRAPRTAAEGTSGLSSVPRCWAHSPSRKPAPALGFCACRQLPLTWSPV